MPVKDTIVFQDLPRIAEVLPDKLRPRGVARDTAARSRSLGRPRGVARETAARRGELTGTTRSPPSNQHVLLDLPPYRRRHSCRIWGNFGFERCRSKRRRHHSGSVHVCARMGQARAWRGSLRESANVNCQLICPQCLQCNRVVRYGGGQN